MLYAGTKTGKGLLVVFSTPSPAGTASYEFWQPQLEPGSVASDYEYISIGNDIALCQRYFQTFDGIGAPMQDMTDTFRNAQAMRPVKMRVKPTEFAVMNNCTFSNTDASTDSYINILVQPNSSNFTAYVSDYTADAEL